MRIILLLALAAATESCQTTPAASTPAVNQTAAPQASPHEAQLRAAIPNPDQPVSLMELLPELAAQSPQDWAKTERGAAILAWGKEAAAIGAIPETTYTRYRMFRRTGERPPYEAPYTQKRALLVQETIAAWMQQDDARMDRINDLIWSICEETSWVGPAHEKNEWTIDLFATETAASLAHVYALLGDRLPEEIRNRLAAEIKRRIIDLYLEHATHFWWNTGYNNWTGVCAGSVGEVLLLMERDPERLIQGLTLVLDQLDRFIDNAFESDGGCLEGIGYWDYGLIHYATFAEMLNARTHGAIDLLAQDKIKAIAQYPGKVLIGSNLYASFADSHESETLSPYLAARMAQRTGATELTSLVAGPIDTRFDGLLRNLCWWDGQATTLPPLQNAILPVSSVARLVSNTSGAPTVLAAKGGHNAEPHNHNDIGSFILRINDHTFLCDPGSGLYNKDYFSSKRYENPFASSYGHSVPRIGGKQQSTGKAFCGTLEQPDPASLKITFNKAYDVPSLKEAVRLIKLNLDAVTLTDTYAFEGPGLEVEEALITWDPVEFMGTSAIITSENGKVEIAAEGGIPLKVERLEDACKANQAHGVLSRITAVYPAASTINATFYIRFWKP